MAQGTERGQGGSRWLMLFGLPFAGVGIGILGWLVLPAVLEWHAMQSWTAVPAEVLEAELHASTSDGSTTYRASARYRYEYAANTWENDRVAIMGGSDNLGDFQQVLAARLQMALENGEPVTVYVDPADPANSVVDRELRTGQLAFLLLFGLVFAAAGIGVMVFGWRAGRQQAGALPPGASYAASTPATVRSAAAGGAVIAWVFALFWCGISAAATIAAWDDMTGGNRGALFLLLFDAIGIALLAWAVHATLSARRFGELVLHLDPHPGASGGDAGGWLDLPLPYDAARTFEVTLSCLHVYTRRSNNKTETRRDPVYSDTRHFLGEPSPDGGTRLHYRFPVPAGLPDSTPPSGDHHAWAVDVACALPGVDLSRQFTVPVQAGTKTMALASRVRESQEASLARLEQHMNLAQVAGGVRMDYRAGRDWKGGLGALLFGAVFAAVPVFLVMSGKASGFPEVLFVGIFGLVGAGLAAAGVWMAGNALAVQIDDGGAGVQRFLFGAPVHARQVPRADITGLVALRAGSMSAGTKVTVYYRLALRLADGSDVTVGDGFRGYGEAQRAAEAIATFTRLPFLGERSSGPARPRA